MQYFGVPRCPYCKKRVNLIRTWSLKRQGEYQCPRCGGISNIYLSPLIYVFALLAVFSAGAVYFFHKFILNDVDLTTCFQVILPFVVFFLLSLFMVYLAKPVIKRVSREESGKKGKKRPAADARRAGVNSGNTGHIYADQEDYLPQNDYRTGPFPQERPVNAPAPQAVSENAQPTAVMASPAAQRRMAAQNTAAHRGARRPAAAQNSQTQSQVSPMRGETSTMPRTQGAAQPNHAAARPAPSAGTASMPRAQGAAQPNHAAARPAPSAGTASMPRAQGAAQPNHAAARPAPSGGTASMPRAQSGAQPNRAAARPAPSGGTAPMPRAQSGAQPSRASRPAQQPVAPVTPRREPAARPQTQQPSRRISIPEPRQASHVVSSVEIPSVSDDFFAKYDDPAYVERRLKEIQEKNGKDSQ